MLAKTPDTQALPALLGPSLLNVWMGLCSAIEEKYDMEHLWNSGGKAWTYEYKYRKGGKTLCALYAREGCVGFMVIFGQRERERFEAERETYAVQVVQAYDEAQTYRDGKWIMFTPTDTCLFDDFIRLLQIKRKPNRN